jgi:hypothetical protein
MPTNTGRAFVLARLSAAHDLASLRRVWDSLSVAYQRDPVVRQFKDKLKAQMEAE